jgi:hypothetical protein
MSAIAAQSPASTGSPIQQITADQFEQFLVHELARRFKGYDPEVDARIDANAAIIMGRPDLPLKRIPAAVKGAPRVPPYLEGEPGVGKTSVIKSAILKFCDIVGLNFVENPADGYEMGPKDFYYAMVNLSGKSDTMDLGGIPMKNRLQTERGVELRRRANDAGGWLMAETESRAKALAAFTKMRVGDTKTISKGDMVGTEITIMGEPDKVDVITTTIVNTLGEEVKKHGVGLAVLRDGEEPQEGRLYIQVKKGPAGSRVTAWAPQSLDADDAYVCEMLPNRRFAMAAQSKFCLFNFDDVANSSEAVRNVLLEVAQSNRYSGVMDLGNAMVTFTGNMGAEDGTNTQSEQSDAEVTRVCKFIISDTPKAWAQRTATRYSATGGDCYMSAFVEKYGHEDGIFRQGLGDARSAKGTPKPNSRSLENALSMIQPYFVMAREANCSVSVFADEISRAFKGCTGGFVETRYSAFLAAMVSDAIPLADQLMKTGKVDEAKLTAAMGAGAKSSDRDFTFRFGTALADAYVDRIALTDEARNADAPTMKKLIQESTARLCTGLAKVEAGVMTQALSRVMARLSVVPSLATNTGSVVKLNTEAYMDMAAGFAVSVNANVWVDADKAEKDFISVMAGTNSATAPKVKAAARP